MEKIKQWKWWLQETNWFLKSRHFCLNLKNEILSVWRFESPRGPRLRTNWWHPPRQSHGQKQHRLLLGQRWAKWIRKSWESWDVCGGWDWMLCIFLVLPKFYPFYIQFLVVWMIGCVSFLPFLYSCRCYDLNERKDKKSITHPFIHSSLNYPGHLFDPLPEPKKNVSWVWLPSLFHRTFDQILWISWFSW